MKRVQQGRASRGFDSPLGGFGSVSSGTLSYLTEPPSFAAVSDPNLVVSLKNLLKKDSTTKTKALEDLLYYVQAHPFDQGPGVDEALLDIWAKLYPRISIDNSRRVRELSHSLQLQLMKSARKRMERHIPNIVGAWLSGLYDRDRVVVRTAQDSLSSFLNTPEKLSAFWSKCQPPILDYAIEAAQETRDTLSDERTTTAEDADAKYFRVIAASLSLVLSLLQLDTGVNEKSRPKLDAFFADEVVWKCITFNDSQVRKVTCQLLFMCIERHLPYTESAKTKQAFITGGLKTNQSGSALEYVRALTKLTQHCPDVWAASSGEKKTPFSRLQAFIAKGSQGSPAKFWECLDQLLASIPNDHLTLEEASDLMSSLQSGITSRDEPRTNTSFSWKCHVDTAHRCLNALSGDDQLALTKQHLFPLLEQFLFPVSEKPTSISLGPNAITILVDIHVGLVQASRRLAESVAGEWARLGTLLCKDISASLPEVSKEFQASQVKVGEQGRRWFGLVGSIHSKSQELNGDLDNTSGPSTQIVLDCITLLENRNLKPYGAAQALEYALSTSPHLFTKETGESLARFLRLAAKGMEKVIGSPSSRNLFSCLNILGTIPGLQGDYESLWSLWTQASLDLSAKESRNAALAQLVSQENAAPLAKNFPKIQELVRSQIMEAIETEENATEGNARTFFKAAIVNEALDSDTSRHVGGEMVALLGKDTQHSESILDLLEAMAKRQPKLFCQQEAIHTDLVAQLLSLSEVGDNSISPRAARVRSLLDGHGDGTLPVVEIIQYQIWREPAKRAVDTTVRWEDLCPNTNVWMAELSTLLEQPVNPTLSITSGIGGAVTLPRVSLVPPRSRIPTQRDRQGRSVPGRMALYTLGLLSSAPVAVDLPHQFHVELLYLQCLSIQLASDQVTSLEVDGLWATLEDEYTMAQAEELVTLSRNLVSKILTAATQWDKVPEHGISRVVGGLVELTMNEAMYLTPRGVYSARVLTELLQTLTEAHGAPASLEETFLKPSVLKATPETALLAAGLMAGLGWTLKSSKAASNFCNRLVSDVAGTSPENDQSMMTLVLLTLCAQVYEPGQLPVANNRVVFAVKQITSWSEDLAELDSDFCAEMCRALGQLLPCMKDVYGSYWEKTVQFCLALWERAGQHVLSEALPFIHSSLKLLRVLEGMQDANDDLQDALREVATAKCSGLLELMKLPREGASQPMVIVDAMLCRETGKIPVARLPEPKDVFPLVASASRDIQTAAFEMLHKKIPAQQEEQSINVLLDKIGKYARLPDELLSLLLDPPTLERYSDEALSLFPSPVRCYLLSWKLLFDAFSTPSLKVRSDFARHVKTGEFVRPLLDFLFDVLGHSAAHPLNLDKEGIGEEQICEYDIGLADSEPGEQSMHWLLAHLYYLTLRYLPGLFKSWYINCPSKQTRIAVEAWTTRYFSPLIVADTLDKVQAWAESQDAGGDDDKELLVKVSKAVREVTAGYEVDESQAAIVIKVPADYPIGAVAVASLHRVAVTERKWQSWIMTTQGVIAFSNGSIVDGLQVFRRNVAGALKGQSECAICYSIISADHRMPDKRCTTCKNLFHRSCLYKWFQSSNQNTCPLCRNPIDYLGADTAKRRQG
ncbi:C3HC4 type (RING finger) zinc finger containing protein [Ophiocordyceps sinensis CO18]|uniref:E3 ubiquitin-protein ligase listerin n=1 Tax=Ophiocordyceps sinensis (strain Co18 / CGMCC 3.14243) TaxID=911162 RepID=T5AN25_OPHSC|nr:C3HC4 type (RING finger) zinc finger containing protein [Ophiocordyceps sinensis CO18]